MTNVGQEGSTFDKKNMFKDNYQHGVERKLQMTIESINNNKVYK